MTCNDSIHAVVIENRRTLIEGRSWNMFINLYQIAAELDNVRFMYCSLKQVLQETGNKFPSERYKCVFSGELDITDPEEAFLIFNLEHPDGYQGCSMSVSDVIEFIHESGIHEFFFCDTFGFKQIDFDKQAVLISNPRNKGLNDKEEC